MKPAAIATPVSPSDLARPSWSVMTIEEAEASTDEFEEELKRRISQQMWRVEAGLITSHRLVEVIQAELEIIFRHRAEAARRLIAWKRRA